VAMVDVQIWTRNIVRIIQDYLNKNLFLQIRDNSVQYFVIYSTFREKNNKSLKRGFDGGGDALFVT
jgi:hypothetical protein